MTNIPSPKKSAILKLGLFFSFLLLCFIMFSFFIFGFEGEAKKGFNPEHIYRTWKLEKLYNKDQVVDSEKYKNLRLQFNRDGTAEWIKLGKSQKINFSIKDDGTQLLIDNGYTLEDIETVFELSENRLRFGKRNIMTKYEYVMVPADSE